ncbi:glycogen-binding domain-containing protein [Hippea alviniae]|uniref:glycogen-binding domain-containing protein n=1 Tax=Hippea alviniae TaxID=1279027 RepID=UPI0003B675FC|nr:glycogen-binding domain-containing protein [Hippea alviniae]
MKLFRKVSGVVAVAFILGGCSSSPYLVKKENRKLVFYAQIPKARHVYFVSSLTNFRKIKATRVEDNLWKAEVPFKPGIVKYFYIVDGHVFVPPCKMKEKDGFGGEDCVYVATKSM